MKYIQPFFLGGAGGLVLTLAIVIGFYVSPLRKSLYLDWDPEISELRDRLEGMRERLQKDEMAIAGSASGSPVSDSLKAAQAGSWKEYRHWRNRLGNLSRLHERATPGEFTAWAYSLRYWFVPAAAVMALFPGLLLAVRGTRRPRLSKNAKPRRAGSRAPNPASAKQEAMASFESAVKQVARLATPVPVLPAPEKKTGILPQETRMPEFPRPASPVPGEPEPEVLRPLPMETPEMEDSPYAVPSGNVFLEPESAVRPVMEEPDAGTRPEGLETQVIQLGPGGWGEARMAPPQEMAPAGQALSMEDEDGEGEAAAQDPPTGHFMPPTTEVERVERRKAEVLKLARKGLTSSEISRRLRISQDQVDFIIRLRREKG